MIWYCAYMYTYILIHMHTKAERCSRWSRCGTLHTCIQAYTYTYIQKQKYPTDGRGLVFCIHVYIHTYIHTCKSREMLKMAEMWYFAYMYTYIHVHIHTKAERCLRWPLSIHVYIHMHIHTKAERCLR
jgi:hypothetical protein